MSAAAETGTETKKVENEPVAEQNAEQTTEQSTEQAKQEG
jgi:hypothetical protein